MGYGPKLFSGYDLITAKTTTVRKDFNRFTPDSGLTLLGHLGKQPFVRHDICDLMRDDHMMLCIDNRLYVIAHHTGLSAGRHGAGVWVRQRYLFLWQRDNINF